MSSHFIIDVINYHAGIKANYDVIIKFKLSFDGSIFPVCLVSLYNGGQWDNRGPFHKELINLHTQNIVTIPVPVVTIYWCN